MCAFCWKAPCAGPDLKKRFVVFRLVFVLPWFFFCLFAFSAASAGAASDPAAVLAPLLGVPYRVDGAVNEKGSYTLFADPQKIFTSPGLNCSGFTLQASRLLLRRDISLAWAAHDRLADSGEGAARGLDWDFGWDLVMNISEGLPRRMLLPGGAEGDIGRVDGRFPRGFDINAPGFWPELAQRLKSGYLYLGAFSKEAGPGDPKPYALLHYHVGIFVRAADGDLWFYHTTHMSKKAFRMNLSTADGRACFLRSFSNTGAIRKMVLLIEVPLPG